MDKRFLISFLLIALAALLQTSFLAYFSWGGTPIHLLLIIAVLEIFLGQETRREKSFFLFMLCGILIDTKTVYPFGVFAFLWIFAYLILMFAILRMEKMVFGFAIALGLAIILQKILFFAQDWFFLHSGRFYWPNFWPEMIYNIIIGCLVYYFYKKICPKAG